VGEDGNPLDILTPPYLENGLANQRPVIQSVSTTNIGWNTNFYVNTPDPASITKVALVRTSAQMHGFDQNQRYVQLQFQSDQANGRLIVTSPLNANIAPRATICFSL
jgi:hypothetical protein